MWLQHSKQDRGSHPQSQLLVNCVPWTWPTLRPLHVISSDPLKALEFGYSHPPGSTEVTEAPKLAPSYIAGLVHTKSALEPSSYWLQTHSLMQLLCNNWTMHPQACNSPHTKTPPAQMAPAPCLLDSPDILRIALHLLPGPLLPQLTLKLLNLLPLSLMLLLSLPHFLHIAEGLRVPALLQILWQTKGGRKQDRE